MAKLFTIQYLKDLAKKQGAEFFQDSHDTIRIVYDLKSEKYTEMYFGSEQNGFWKYYN